MCPSSTSARQEQALAPLPGAAAGPYADPTGLKFIGSDGGGGGTHCGRICQQTLEDIDELYPGDGVQSPAVAESVEGRPPRARVLDWVASGSDLGWSRYLVGERDPLVVFAALINGIDCETGIGCAPVNPGAVGVSLTATLTFRSPLRAGRTGWELRASVAALLNRLNPQSGYELQKLRLIIVDASGSPIRVQPVVEGPMVTSTRLDYALQIHIPADLPQPRRVIATAWAFPSEMNRQPITAQAEVVFDATPLAYGPFPS